MSLLLFFLICFIYFHSSIFLCRIDATNQTQSNIPTLEDLFSLNPPADIERIAAQFGQNPDWEASTLPIDLSEEEETKPIHRINGPYPPRQGIEKSPNIPRSKNLDPYLINRENVHRESVHHIIFVRHGLYYYTEDEPNSHLLRYGKYQARMAGQKIDRVIREIIDKYGPLTEPITLVSSTQTRAYETLYNLRLQLGNDLDINPQVILDPGVTECNEPPGQIQRWLYFVREYLQPKNTNKFENHITLVSSHGNLLSAFHHIIEHVVNRDQTAAALVKARLPRGTTFLHAQAMLYQAIGTRPISFLEKLQMVEIPITINHVQLRREIYNQWAFEHKCRSQYGRDQMEFNIKTAVLDQIFGFGEYENARADYVNIVRQEMIQEYERHLLPMMMYTCRIYLGRLMHMKVNSDFMNFNRHMSPVPIPNIDERSEPFDHDVPRFSAYGLPYPVNTEILRIDDTVSPHFREPIDYHRVHPESRSLVFLVRPDKFLVLPFIRLNVDTGDPKTSHLARVGINQLRGAAATMHAYLGRYKAKLSHVTIKPIVFITEPTIHSAESCFLIRDLLESVQYNVSEIITDLALQLNIVHPSYKPNAEHPRVLQYRYLLNKYWKPIENDGHEAIAQIYVMCSEGVLFMDFIDTLIKKRVFRPPTRPVRVDTQFMKHANFLITEAVGNEDLTISEMYSLRVAGVISDNYKIETHSPLRISSEEMSRWLHDRAGRCSLDHFVRNQDQLAANMAFRATTFDRQLVRLLVHEWNPYLAGMFIYACRLRLTQALGPRDQNGLHTNVTATAAAMGDDRPEGGGGAGAAAATCGDGCGPSAIPKNNVNRDCF